MDASSAFDHLSWSRIRDFFISRRIPPTLTKLILIQLSLTKISVCNTRIFFARNGVKQGGILSGIIFSACYDNLVYLIKRTRAGLLLKNSNNLFTFIQILIYADDIILFSRSPYGLKLLIDKAISFCNLYNDISFNASKSVILRLGSGRKPPVSVCNIPTAESAEYLGIEIGRQADPQKTASALLYRNTNIMMKQNQELKKCSVHIKNIAIYAYGSVYGIETFEWASPCLRSAHRYLTKTVHCDWRRYADLDGPNIRSRRLYTAFELDSMEVIHRKRRNTFLLKAADSENNIIREIIGGLERITG